MGAPDRQKKICIIAYKPLERAPRILRQADSFARKGWQVTLAGFWSGGEPPSGTRLLIIERIAPRRSWTIPQALARLLLPSGLAWSWHPQNRAAREAFRRDGQRYDYIIAHDWTCAPLACELAAEQGISFGIDVHEYAREQFCPTGRIVRDFLGKYAHNRHADAIQRRYLPLASGITTVCDGIADLLQADYRLAIRPGVVRSVPFFEAIPYRPCRERIRILYHGSVDYSRNLDVLVKATALLDERFEVEIRGPGEETYKEELKALAQRCGVGARVHFTEAVPFADIVRAAARADIGYEVVDGFSPQHRFMLPNKFFENTMAGLALCVSNSQEMSRLVAAYKHGVCVNDCSPEAVAAVLNGLTREQINEMKQASLRAAKELCWEKEEAKMLAAYGVALVKSCIGNTL